MKGQKTMNNLNKQEKTEKLLYIAALVLTECYLLVSVFRHFVPAYDRLIAVLQWCSLILALSALLYWFFVKRRELQSREEKKKLLSRFGSYEQVYMVYVFFWYIITVALRQLTVGGTHFLDNDLWMYVTGMMAFLFFPFVRYAGKNEKAKRTVEAMLHTVIIPYAVLAAWIIWNYFRMNYISFPSGQQLMREPPAILYFSELNHIRIGEQALIMIGCCLYMMLTQTPAVKTVYALCFAVNLILLILTNARTSWYMAVSMMACAAFLFCRDRTENRKTGLRLAIGILAAAAVILCCHGTRVGVFQLLQKVTIEAEKAEAAAAAETKGIPESASLRLQPLRHDEGENRFSPSDSEPYAVRLSDEGPERDGDYIRTVHNNRYQLNERIKTYRACLYVMFTSRYRFLFGVTPSDLGQTILGVYGVDIPYGHAHNFFLQMGVSYGVPTMIATIVFAVSLLVRSIRILFINRKKLFSGAWAVCLTVIFILGNDMFSGRLNASPDFICTGFYLFAGWIVAMDMDTRAPRKDGKHAWF